RRTPLGSEPPMVWRLAAEASMQHCATMGGLESCLPTMAQSVPSRYSQRIIYSKPQTGIGTQRHSRQGEQRRILAMATNSGLIPARNEGLRCSAFMASRSSSIRSSNLSWQLPLSPRMPALATRHWHQKEMPFGVDLLTCLAVGDLAQHDRNWQAPNSIR